MASVPTVEKSVSAEGMARAARSLAGCAPGKPRRPAVSTARYLGLMLPSRASPVTRFRSWWIRPASAWPQPDRGAISPIPESRATQTGRPAQLHLPSGDAPARWVRHSTQANVADPRMQANPGTCLRRQRRRRMRRSPAWRKVSRWASRPTGWTSGSLVLGPVRADTMPWAGWRSEICSPDRTATACWMRGAEHSGSLSV
jgi:hypothetical protein